MNLVVGRNTGCVADVTDREFIAHFRHRRTITRDDYLGMIAVGAPCHRGPLFIGFFETERLPQELLNCGMRSHRVSTDVDWRSFTITRYPWRRARSASPRLRAVLERPVFQGNRPLAVAVGVGRRLGGSKSETLGRS